MNDRRLIYTAAFLRALATGMAGVLPGLTLARLGFSAAAIGAGMKIATTCCCGAHSGGSSRRRSGPPEERE